MCLASIRSEYEALHLNNDYQSFYENSFFAYKIIQRDLRSMFNSHFWAPGYHFLDTQAKFHPLSKKFYTIHHSFHAFRYLKDAKQELSIYPLNDCVLIRIKIERMDVTGANLSQVSARKVYWGGDYLCKDRWKKLKINW